MAIFSKYRPCCDLCGSTGTTLHPQITDHLFGVPGVWNHRECQNPARGLVWLDPCPIDADIDKLYESYCTHQPQGNTLTATLLLSAEKAGFTGSCCRTTAAKAETFALGSLALTFDMPAGALPARMKIAAMSFQPGAWLYQLIQPNSGEKCILLAEKALPVGSAQVQA